MATAAEIGTGLGKYQLAGSYTGNHLEADRGLKSLYVGYTATTLNIMLVGSAESPTAGAYRAFILYLNTPARLGAQARMTMADAVSAKPDYEAQLRSVAQKTGVPVDTVRAFPDEMNKQATLGAYDFDRMAEQFPNTTRFLGDPDKAALVPQGELSMIGNLVNGIIGRAPAASTTLVALTLSPFTAMVLWPTKWASPSYTVTLSRLWR